MSEQQNGVPMTFSETCERCPKCGGEVIRRERRPNGNSLCENGHEFPSATAMEPREAELNVKEWKHMVKKMIAGSAPRTDAFIHWMAECALHAWEHGDVDDEVNVLLETNERMELCNRKSKSGPPPNPEGEER